MMRLVKLGFVLCLLFIVSKGFAQVSFMHSGGLSLYSISSGVNSSVGPALMYSPRLNLVKLSDELTLSVGTHIGIDFFLSSNGNQNSSTFDIPLVAELNFGHGAIKQTKSKFGGFVGLGYGFTSIKTNASYEARGVLLNGGLRFVMFKKSFGLRVAYLLNSVKDVSDVSSFGLFYTFGYKPNLD